MKPKSRRHRFAYLLGLIGLAAISSTALTSTAEACSCRRNPTAQGILATSAAVFTGTVQATEHAGARTSVTTFVVKERFKGTSVGAVVRIRHRSGSSASCGVRFVPGSSYTLRANRGSDGHLTTSLCGVWMFLPHVPISKRLISDLRNASR